MHLVQRCSRLFHSHSLKLCNEEVGFEAVFKSLKLFDRYKLRKYTNLPNVDFAVEKLIYECNAATAECVKPLSDYHNNISLMETLPKSCTSYNPVGRYLPKLMGSLTFSNGTRKYCTKATNSSASVVEELMRRISQKNEKYLSLKCSSEENERRQRRAFLHYIRQSLLIEEITEDKEMCKMDKASSFAEEMKLGDLTVEKIKKIHSMIVDDDDGGKIRKNWVGLRNPITGEVVDVRSPDDIAQNLQILVSSTNEHENPIPPLILALQLKLSFVRIHPFRDGNGRLSRLLFNWMLRRQGFQIWTTFPANEVNEYYNAIGASNEWIFYEYALNCVDRSYSDLLNEFPPRFSVSGD